MFFGVKTVVLNDIDAACLENREQNSDLACLSVTPFRPINLSPVRYISNRGNGMGCDSEHINSTSNWLF